mmetsp:Transcript_39693/g.77685  ORF Transcript_39693/g.77685 Transcript_39693/m.77685 type:complete len:202 (-) Transcript_39693:482-1087(-)
MRTSPLAQAQATKRSVADTLRTALLFRLTHFSSTRPASKKSRNPSDESAYVSIDPFDVTLKHTSTKSYDMGGPPSTTARRPLRGLHLPVRSPPASTAQCLRWPLLPAVTSDCPSSLNASPLTSHTTRALPASAPPRHCHRLSLPSTCDPTEARSLPSLENLTTLIEKLCPLSSACSIPVLTSQTSTEGCLPDSPAARYLPH